MPTLIIHGVEDATVPIDLTARAAAKAVPGAKLIEYDDGAHGLFASHKERLIGDLLGVPRRRSSRPGDPGTDQRTGLLACPQIPLVWAGNVHRPSTCSASRWSSSSSA